ncbi:MAG: site-2 protease family protein [Patescibacteria group bacterium]|nr:site-2 protease family protein [Patescibacteria group bacterium]
MSIGAIVIFVIVLAALIFVHELGHFLAAKAFGIRVDAFKLGFGPRVFSWKRGETEYGVNWIPFGGYVKIFGEDPDGAALDPAGSDARRSFVLKARWKQAVVLSAGVLFNFIFAWLLYAGAFTAGVTASTDGFQQYASHLTDPRIMVTSVVPGSPADKAGVKAGDTVEGVISGGVDATGKAGPVAIKDVQDAIASSDGAPLELLTDKGAVGMTGVEGLVPGKYAIGIAMDDVAELKLPFFAAVGESFRYTLELIKETAVGLYQFVANIFVGHPDLADVAGPVGIAGIVGNAARMGITYLVMVTAIISVNLGVINLIPFPALDGGRILFVAVEGAFRRRIPPRFANAVNLAGFALLMILMVAVTWKDVAQLVAG